MGAFDGDEMVGMITGELGGGYWLQTAGGEESTCFINEFVVNPSYLPSHRPTSPLSVHPTFGIFGVHPQVKEMYTTVHVDNITSRTAFIKGGYHEVITYKDQHRDRNTTVLKYTPGGYSVQHNAIRGNTRPMQQVIGIQSGNAVDGIDEGIFEFEPPRAIRMTRAPSPARSTTRRSPTRPLPSRRGAAVVPDRGDEPGGWQ